MKLIKITFMAVAVLAAMLALAACGCEHVYIEKITREPTCAQTGEKTLVCSLCGKTEVGEVELKEHSYLNTVVTVSCTADGYIEHTCSVCGYSYTDYHRPAKGHSYVPTVTVPTCAKEGYTTYTCSECDHSYTGDKTPKDPSVHIFEYAPRELTAAEAAANPDAIGAMAEVCGMCGFDSGKRQATLVYVDFDGDIDVDAYVGSDAYRKAVGKMTDEQKKAVAMVDAQKNMDLRSGGYGISLTEDGKAEVTGSGVQFNTTLSLGTVVCPIPTYTICFDLTVNAVPKADVEHERDLPVLFSVNNNLSYYNNRPIKLALSGVDLDTDPEDDVHTYELYAQSILNGLLKNSQATGYRITLGREYSFKLEVTHSAQEDDTFTVFVRETGDVQYTNVGTYKLWADTRTPFVTGFWFDYFGGSVGNLIDNLVVVAPFAE